MSLIEISGGLKDQIKLRARLKRQAGEDEAYFLSALVVFRREVGRLPLALTGGLRSRACHGKRPGPRGGHGGDVPPTD